MRNWTLAAAAILAVSVAWGADPPATQPEPPVPLQDMLQRGIAGRLGARLGTIIEVEGQVVANTPPSKADDGIPYLLSITSVDGHALPEAVWYAFIRDNQWVKAKDPKIGDKFHYVGYESGAFIGSPPAESAYMPLVQTMGWGFQTKFYVVAAK